MRTDPSHQNCPVFTTLSLLANKWSVTLLHELLNAEAQRLRFSVLKTNMNGITQRELTRQLRQFEAAGIVTRTVQPVRPPRVDYALTPLGASLCAPIEALAAWAETHGAEVQRQRAAFASRDQPVV